MADAMIAVLAHDDRRGLELFLRNIRAFEPDVPVVFFNGGGDPGLGRGLDVEICPYSTRMRYGKTHRFHVGVMRWLHEQRIDFSFLITTEPDMALVKPGFVAACNEIMAREGSSYIGAQYGRQVNVGFPIGLTHKKWVHGWQPVLGTEYPSWAINPGQVFGRAYVERFLEFPDLDRVLDLSDATGVWGPEEFIYPTMADAMGCNPVAYPSQSAIGARRHSPAAIRDFIADPRVHWIHKVGQKPDDYDRAIVMALAAGTQPDWEDAERSYRPQTAIRRIGRRALKAKRYQLAGHFRRA